MLIEFPRTMPFHMTTLDLWTFWFQCVVVFNSCQCYHHCQGLHLFGALVYMWCQEVVPFLLIVVREKMLVLTLALLVLPIIVKKWLLFTYIVCGCGYSSRDPLLGLCCFNWYWYGSLLALALNYEDDVFQNGGWI